MFPFSLPFSTFVLVVDWFLPSIWFLACLLFLLLLLPSPLLLIVISYTELHTPLMGHGVHWGWCGGSRCAIILSAMWTSSISSKSVYDPLCPNKCFMNSLRRSFFCSLIAISYIELHTPLMGHGVHWGWCGVGRCAIILSVMWTSSISNKSVYDPLCPNKCFMNSLRRSFICSLIANSYIELHTPFNGTI